MSKKYILQPDGSVKKEDRQIISIREKNFIATEEKTYSSKEINEIAKERAVKSFQDIKHEEGLGIGAGFSSSPINFIEEASTNLVTNEDVFVKDPAFSESNTNFPKKDSFLLNSSFGADEGIKYQTDFNSVFTEKGDIFASEAICINPNLRE